jgi:hypothetical protein
MLGKQTSERLAALFTPAQLTRLAQAQRLLEEIENAECDQRLPSSKIGDAEVIDVECEQGVRQLPQGI